MLHLENKIFIDKKKQKNKKTYNSWFRALKNFKIQEGYLAKLER